MKLSFSYSYENTKNQICATCNAPMTMCCSKCDLRAPTIAQIEAEKAAMEAQAAGMLPTNEELFMKYYGPGGVSWYHRKLNVRSKRYNLAYRRV